MKPLYEIANDYLSIVKELIDVEEITVEQLKLLDQHQDSLEEKIINIGAFIKNLEAEHQAIENAIDSMVERSIRVS
ncbi:MAG TPA: siphovirus Gp157 family protein, partial [Puia sp.]|nr:siphovirus Gp157 family protein [Puia sp.]